MDPNFIFTFGVPALVIGSFIWRKLRPAIQSATATAAGAITPETIAQATEDAPLATRAWLNYVNRQPDRVPHLAVIGPSGAGKTTFTTAVLADRLGQIIVITAKEGDDWGGLNYIGIDEDATYTSAQVTFTELESEVKRRLVATKHKTMTADWLTIVVDDFSTLVKEAPVAASVVKLVARLGRSLRVRLVMLSDSALVKAIGLEGEGETRSNFAFVRLARGHRGIVTIDGADVPIDTRAIPRLAQQANLAGRDWRVPRDPDVELMSYLGLSDDKPVVSGTSDQTRPDQTVQTDPSERVLMRKYRIAGLSREQARRLFADEDLGFDNNVWTEVGKELGGV